MSCNIGVILGGGLGTRFKGTIPKQYVKLNGKEIIAYSIEAFTKAKALDAFVVVVDEKSYKNGSVAEKYGVDCILGGNSRNASVRNALDYIKVKYPDCKNVMIHEAVGVVVQDKSGTLARGTRVAMVPNISPAEHTIVKDNYSRDSKFQQRRWLYAGFGSCAGGQADSSARGHG